MNEYDLKKLQHTIMGNVAPACADIALETDDEKLRDLAYAAFIQLHRLCGYLLELENPQYFAHGQPVAPQVPQAGQIAASDPAVVPFPAPSTASVTEPLRSPTL